MMPTAFGETVYYDTEDGVACDFCEVYEAQVALTPFKESENIANVCFHCLERLCATAKEAYKHLLEIRPKVARPREE